MKNAHPVPKNQTGVSALSEQVKYSTAQLVVKVAPFWLLLAFTVALVEVVK